MIPFQLQRLGLVMEPEPGNPLEAEGVLNPAAARGPDGQLYLFPRLVARGNYSRIGIARVRFNEAGDPAGVERLGIALEPEADYERRRDGSGGCEDPRITFVEPLRRYVMTYTALSPEGPRIALAISEDLFRWQRLGLATFRPYDGIEFDGVDNKDRQRLPCGHSRSIRTTVHGHPPPAALSRDSSGGNGVPPCVPLGGSPSRKHLDFLLLNGHGGLYDPYHLCHFGSHHRLATPVAPWERLKIGGGAPPILTRHGWLTIYHGVSELSELSESARKLRYSAGVLVLSEEHPRYIRFGVARLDVPEHLPPGGLADPPGIKV